MIKLFFGIVLLPFSLLAQRPLYDAIDRHADTTTEENFDRIGVLTKALIRPAQNDTQKTRAIFSWLARNIKYDSQGLNSRKWANYQLDEHTAAITFNYRKGICGGFAILLKTMLDTAKIENEIVTGNARGEELNGQDTLRSNHVWNSVKIDGKWQLLDATWANVNWNRHLKVGNQYFLPDPAQFVLTHYPDSAKWLLYENPMSYETYRKLPWAGENYFDLGFGPAIPGVEQFDDKVVFTLQVPAGLEMGAILRNRQTLEEINCSGLRITKTGQLTRIEIPVSGDGPFELELTAVPEKPPFRRHFGILTASIHLAKP